jgi:hypothetical protein
VFKSAKLLKSLPPFSFVEKKQIPHPYSRLVTSGFGSGKRLRSEDLSYIFSGDSVLEV